MSVEPALRERIEVVLGGPIRGVRRMAGGYTPALRLVVTLADGRSAFVKAGTTPDTAEWLRREHELYRAVAGPFMPELLGWDDDDVQPLLALADLSRAHWPPPWREGEIQHVLAGLRQIASRRVSHLPRLRDDTRLLDGWQRVAADPQPFLSLGLVGDSWLRAALPVLLQIDAPAAVDGEALLHNDVRSDNLCFLDGRALFVDWNLACTGQPDWDVAAWLPSLEAEGGPPPEAILPDAGALAGIIAGYFASRAGMPLIPDAPRVRHIQRVQLRTALPWAVRALGLPPLDGRLRGGR